MLALTVAVGVAAGAFGRDAGAMQLTPGQKSEMKQHYDKATRAYDIQKYTEAVEEYQKAYEIGGDPAMLYNVAQSYRLNDQLPDALRFYRRYLQRSPNARNREDVERKIADLERTIAERRRAVATTVPMAPNPSTPTLAVPAASQPPTSQAVTEEGIGATTVVGIVVASIGGAGLITAGITGYLAKKKGDQLSEDSMMMKQYDPSLQSDGKSLDTLAKIFSVAGGAAVLTGAVMIAIGLSSGSPEHKATAVKSTGGGMAFAPVVGPGVMGAAASVRF
jgi:tetratricopeptide (TPR) repeat protein